MSGEWLAPDGTPIDQSSVPHGTASRWRTGCRCPECRQAHNAETNLYRPGREEIPGHILDAVLAVVAKGTPLDRAADLLEVSVARLRGLARRDQRWRERLDAALMAGRDPGIAHGTEMGYRHHRCRCPECQLAHNGPLKR